MTNTEPTTEPGEIPAAEILPGTVLRNGYIVIATRGFKPASPGKLAAVLVLAMRLSRSRSGPDDTEYASWVATSSYNTYWGRYSHDFAESVETYLERSFS